jgi:hypothetical protein
MKWIKIQKNSITISKYTERGVKESLQKEGEYQCVYCALKDNVLGGIDHYHVEHYRPVKHFSHLEHDYQNLFYSCPICNRFKGPDWPAEPDSSHSIPSYPNPSEVDYNDLFNIDIEAGLIEGIYVASKYVEKRLYLNRPHLLLERRRSHLNKISHKLNINTTSLVKQLKSINTQKSMEYLAGLCDSFSRLHELFLQLENIPSYEAGDIRKK